MLVVLACGLGVGSVMLLPICQAVGIAHLDSALLDGLSERVAISTLMRRNLLRVLAHRVVADNGLAVAVCYIKLAVTREAALQFVQ